MYEFFKLYACRLEIRVGFSFQGIFFGYFPPLISIEREPVEGKGININARQIRVQIFASLSVAVWIRQLSYYSKAEF